jgi:DNA replication protein DnaD
MDEQTKQALQELQETVQAFEATVARCIEQEQVQVEEIQRLAAQIRHEAELVRSTFKVAAYGL